MTFKPYETYRAALPVLKVGHVIKAGAGSKGGSGFWIIRKVMEGRIKITESVTDPYQAHHKEASLSGSSLKIYGGAACFYR